MHENSNRHGRPPVPVTDHLGNGYPDLDAMCGAYGIKPQTLRTRLRRGMPLGQALTEPVRYRQPRVRKKDPKDVPIRDHLGNEYANMKALAAAYGLSRQAIFDRIMAGMTLEQALTASKENKQNTPVKDHLGNEYPDLDAMCEAYGIKTPTVRSRLRKGLGLERALTDPVSETCGSPRRATDHLGNEYPSQKAMCDAWGVDPTAYCRSIRNGRTVEQALTAPKQNPPEKRTDHTGKTFPTVQDMCDAWNVSINTYRRRLKEGMDTERALTTVEIQKNARPATDHTGRTFPSTSAMCRAWGIDMSTYRNRKKAGYGIERILTQPRQPRAKSCRDHTGRKFKSVKEMCAAHGVDVSTYADRRKRGLGVRDALSKDPPGERRGHPCRDHTGRKFPSMAAMARAWGLLPNTYRLRRRAGASIRDALTPGRMPNDGPRTDHTGQTFPSIKAMCEAWGVPYRTYGYRIRTGQTKEQALTGAVKGKPRRPAASTDHLGNTYPTLKAMCAAWHVQPQTYRLRIRKGMTVEQALTRKPWSKEPPKGDRKGNGKIPGDHETA